MYISPSAYITSFICVADVCVVSSCVPVFPDFIETEFRAISVYLISDARKRSPIKLGIGG
jgi:hypothetical protein